MIRLSKAITTESPSPLQIVFLLSNLVSLPEVMPRLLLGSSSGTRLFSLIHVMWPSFSGLAFCSRLWGSMFSQGQAVWAMPCTACLLPLQEEEGVRKGQGKINCRWEREEGGRGKARLHTYLSNNQPVSRYSLGASFCRTGGWKRAEVQDIHISESSRLTRKATQFV